MDGFWQKSIEKNDLPHVLSAMSDSQNVEQNVDYHIEEKSSILEYSNSLWIYDYIESLPPKWDVEAYLEKLEEHVEPSGVKFKPYDSPEEQFNILGVKNTIGVYLNEVMQGEEINQSYIKVQTNDFVYNPHRVNVGSIGIVPEHLSGGIVPGIYVVFRLKSTSTIPPHYFLYLLKTQEYLNIIRAYDTKHGAVRANLKYEQLQRIKFYVPSQEELNSFISKNTQLQNLRDQANKMESELIKSILNNSK